MNKTFRSSLLVFSVVVVSLLAQGCGGIPWAYTLPINQGNELRAEQVAQLEPDMTEAQVRFLLGTPMIKDAFHPSRWDYAYHEIKKRKVIQHYHLSVFFENGRVSHFEKEGV